MEMEYDIKVIVYTETKRTRVQLSTTKGWTEIPELKGLYPNGQYFKVVVPVPGLVISLETIEET